MTRYVLTDPCYILPREIWAACCKKVSDEKAFSNAVAKALQDFTGDEEARAVTTGGGDWCNQVKGSSKKIISANFTSDSGTACFCAFNDIVKKALENNRIKEGCYAVLELEGDFTFTYDLNDKNWTEIYIFNGCMLSTLSPDELDGGYYD